MNLPDYENVIKLVIGNGAKRNEESQKIAPQTFS